MSLAPTNLPQDSKGRESTHDRLMREVLGEHGGVGEEAKLQDSPISGRGIFLDYFQSAAAASGRLAWRRQRSRHRRRRSV